MKKVPKLMKAISTSLKGEKVTKEGCIVFRQGNFRTLRIVTASQWLATLNEIDRPSSAAVFPAKIYNGSTYVDCAIFVNTNGQVRVETIAGTAVPGAQYGYLTPRYVSYYVG